MRPAPDRIERLPEQYFAALLARVAEASALPGAPVIDLGRGNPDVPPPAHVAARLAEVAAGDDARVHGYAPFAGLRKLKEAVAERYRDVYRVALDPEREVAILPGTKTALVDFALCVAERGSTIVLPDPGYPDYFSAVALAGARVAALPIEPRPDFSAVLAEDVAAVYLNYPSNPAAAAVPDGTFAEAVAYAERTGAVVLHDFAYGDLVFDARPPASFLAEPGAKEAGVELFSMSKSYGMAGWRLGFVVGNAEIVRRLELLNDHVRAGIFVALQEAAVAALTGPQDSVEERRALYEARRDRVVAAIPGARSEGTFFVWLRLPDGVTVERILEETRVALAPGEGFGSRGAGHARISLAIADEVLDEGLERVRRLLVS
ncbi:MAG: aminotransferase class I/II-fold pyridoxal phosphate-dependent enzyme [Actinomycetota bacterium]|nr:aminotransferase class I/II-fold pyridoxal phosphate-dependent enzyme [Actinomycetota bacterium]